MQEDAIDRMLDSIRDTLRQIVEAWDNISDILDSIDGLYGTKNVMTGHRLNLTSVPQASKRHVQFSPMNRFDMCRPTSGFL